MHCQAAMTGKTSKLLCFLQLLHSVRRRQWLRRSHLLAYCISKISASHNTFLYACWADRSAADNIVTKEPVTVESLPQEVAGSIVSESKWRKWAFPDHLDCIQDCEWHFSNLVTTTNKADVWRYVGSWQFVKTATWMKTDRPGGRIVYNCNSVLVVYSGHYYCLLPAAAAWCALSDLLSQIIVKKFRLCFFWRNVKQRVCAVQRSYVCRAGADWGQSVICCLGPGDRRWYHQRAYSRPAARLRFYISSSSSSSPPTRTSHQVHSSVVSAFIFLFLMHCRKYARRSPPGAANDLFPSIFSTKGSANVVFMFTCCQS